MRLAGRILVAAATIAGGGMLYGDSGDALVAQATVGSSNATSSSADSSTTNSRPARPSANAKKEAKARLAPRITPERETAVLAFVQRNHAQLAELLGYLKSSQPDEYDRAIREINRTTERLAQIQERDPLQYELEVAVWTAQSRVQLLAARLKMESSDDLLARLRDALGSHNEAKLSLLQHERKKATDRLNRIDADIARLGLDGDRESVIEKQLKLLTRAADEDRPLKVGTKAAAKQGKQVKKKP